MSANPKESWKVPVQCIGEVLIEDAKHSCNSTVRSGAAIALGLFRLAEAIEYAADQSLAVDSVPLGIKEPKSEK